MADGYYLSAEDKDKLADIYARVFGTGRQVGSGVGFVNSPDHLDNPSQSPEVYVAYSSSGVPAREGNTAGKEQCDIYKLVPGTGDDVFDLEQVLNPDDSAVQQWVYNVHGSSTPMGYFIVWREKFGRWLAAPSAPTPHFSPLLTSTTVDEVTTWECGITWGWFHGPRARDDADTKEVPDWDRWPWMPEINEVRLDDATPEKLAFTNAATNITYLAVTLKERNVGIGDTLLPGFTGLQGVSGTTGYAPTGVTTENNTAPPDAHNHNVIEPETTIGTPPDDITVDGHYHDAQVDLQAVAYHIDPGVPPEFLVTTGNVPRNTELTRYIPWGKHVLDAAGIMTTAEWYWTGDRDFSVESWVRGAYSEGNIGSVTLGPTQPADDIGANPHPHGSVPSPWPTPPD